MIVSPAKKTAGLIQDAGWVVNSCRPKEPRCEKGTFRGWPVPANCKV